jgi:FtsZ-interacting cell division protein YlmF
MWNRTLVYLGLKEEPDEVYDELAGRFVPGEDPDAAAVERPARRERPVDRAVGAGSAAVAREPELRAVDASNVRALRAADGAVAAQRVAQVAIRDFEDVEAVGARYRTGQPVLFDLVDAPAATARRVVDFVSGLTYALRGELTKVGTRAFLLVPDGVRLPVDERRRLTELGYRVPARPQA